jgi:galactose mutarotase-like enzyme
VTGYPPRLVLSSNELTAELLPEWGSKMISLRTEPDSYEFLAPAPLGPHVPDAALFSPADAYGFDEMFPGVYPQPYPVAPWQDVPVADHGDLWYRPWQCSGGGSSAELWVEDSRLGWYFGKQLRFVQPRTLETTYRVENRSRDPLYWLYCAHILCQYRPGIELELPATCYHRHETMGQLLPEDCSEATDFLCRFEAFPDRSAAFYVSDAVGNAGCTYIDRPARKALRLSWSEPAAYLALWYNRDAWMPDQPLTHVALEPTTAGTQDLAEWIRTGTPRPLAPGEHVSWIMTMSVSDMG